jgi:transcriptional regulator with XRE-family HTH domain
MYMVKARAKQRPLRWRPNCIRLWREDAGFTLERAAETLGRAPFNLSYTHNSLGRVENGRQMPPIALIEALAKLYRTDIDSLLNRKPKSDPAPTANGILELWDRAEDEERGLIIDLARRVVKKV